MSTTRTALPARLAALVDAYEAVETVCLRLLVRRGLPCTLEAVASLSGADPSAIRKLCTVRGTHCRCT